MKTSNLSADNFKKILDLDGSTPEPAIRSGDTGQPIPCFDSCQLVTTLISNQWAPKVARKCESKRWYACSADGRSGGAGGQSVYGHVITKFFPISRLLHFLTHGAPLARFARESFAIIGTLRSKEGDENENVAEKVNSRFFNLHRDYSKSLTLSNVGEPS